MGIFDWSRPSLGISLPTEIAPGASDYIRWDVTQAKTINGDLGGGTYSPTTPIIIGGAGLSLPANSVIEGGVRTQTGGTIEIGPDADHLFELYPSRTRSITLSMLDLQPDAKSLRASGVTCRPDDVLALSYPPNPVGVIVHNDLPCGQAIWGGPQTQCGLSIPSRYLHHFNGQLVSVTTTFRLLTPQPPPVWASNLIFSGIFGLKLDGSQSTVPFEFLSDSSFTGLWAAGHTYSAGQYALPNVNIVNPVSCFKASAGTSGGTEPSWNTTPGSTTTDGSVTWTCIGGTGHIWAQNSDAYYADGQPQTVTQAFDTAKTTTLDLTQYMHVLYLQNTNPSILWHSVKFTFGAISVLAFE